MIITVHRTADNGVCVLAIETDTVTFLPVISLTEIALRLLVYG